MATVLAVGIGVAAAAFFVRAPLHPTPTIDSSDLPDLTH